MCACGVLCLALGAVFARGGTMSAEPHISQLDLRRVTVADLMRAVVDGQDWALTLLTRLNGAAVQSTPTPGPRRVR